MFIGAFYFAIATIYRMRPQPNAEAVEEVEEASIRPFVTVSLLALAVIYIKVTDYAGIPLPKLDRHSLLRLVASSAAALTLFYLFVRVMVRH